MRLIDLLLCEITCSNCFCLWILTRSTVTARSGFSGSGEDLNKDWRQKGPFRRRSQKTSLHMAISEIAGNLENEDLDNARIAQKTDMIDSAGVHYLESEYESSVSSSEEDEETEEHETCNPSQIVLVQALAGEDKIEECNDNGGKAKKKKPHKHREDKRRNPVPALNAYQYQANMAPYWYRSPIVGPYYGRPGSNVWLSPAAAARGMVNPQNEGSPSHRLSNNQVGTQLPHTSLHDCCHPISSTTSLSSDWSPGFSDSNSTSSSNHHFSIYII